MQTECSADLFGFAPVDGRKVVAAFDGGRMTSEAGAMLLGATDRQIRMIERFAGCFTDYRAADLIVHEVPGLVGQRVFGIALGYEDLIDHDQPRHDPVMAVLGGKLAAKRADCAPLAGKSTLNRLELSRPEPTRYYKISYDAAAIEGLFVDLFLDAHAAPPPQITLDLDATDDPLHGHQEERFFHGYYDNYCYLPLYVFCGRHLLAAKLRRGDGARNSERLRRQCAGTLHSDRSDRKAEAIGLSSGMHRGVRPRMDDLLWAKRSWSGSTAYAESKLCDVLLAFAAARRWKGVKSNALEPGWVATKMGGPSAPDDLHEGCVTQAWLATSEDALAQSSGGYFHHQRPRAPNPIATDLGTQEELLAECTRICGIPFD